MRMFDSPERCVLVLLSKTKTCKCVFNNGFEQKGMKLPKYDLPYNTRDQLRSLAISASERKQSKCRHFENNQDMTKLPWQIYSKLPKVSFKSFSSWYNVIPFYAHLFKDVSSMF